jgi:hypothetical protein
VEPNPQFVSSLANKLQRFHVDYEAVFWALRALIQADVPLVATEKTHAGPSANKENQ